ncbi:hypothetical protein DL769_011505 [Monosporascus sp. CRB-8-3]|nr:hypothetical protein DL769_011505 [Monosporascus sp. CRB-8-3]
MNEAPQQLVNPITGQNLLAGNNLTEYQSCEKRKDGCVFHQNTVTRVYGTGHLSLATSCDESQDYIVSHAQTPPNSKSDLYRTTRIHKFTRNDGGTPKLPLGENVPSRFWRARRP